MRNKEHDYEDIAYIDWKWRLWCFWVLDVVVVVCFGGLHKI